MAVTKNNESKGEDTMSEEKGKYEKMFENTRVKEIELDKPDTKESEQYANMFSNIIIPDISVGSQEKYIG